MSRLRFSKFVGVLMCSVGLVAGGVFQVLPAMAADDDSFNVTVRVLDKDTGELISDKLSYWSETLQKSVVFDNEATISVNAGDVNDEFGGAGIVFAEGTEAIVKYYSPRVESFGCSIKSADAGSVVTCEAPKRPFSTRLKVVDEDGNSLTLNPSDIVAYVFGYLSPDGETFYYDEYLDGYDAKIEKPGYLPEKLSSLVAGGETKIVLKKKAAGDSTTPGNDGATNSNDSSAPSDNKSDKSSATSGSRVVNNSLAATGSAVGVAGLSALLLIGAGLLLRRRLNH